jgi:hypothetical protein
MEHTTTDVPREARYRSIIASLDFTELAAQGLLHCNRCPYTLRVEDYDLARDTKWYWRVLEGIKVKSKTLEGIMRHGKGSPLGEVEACG